jgi:hypothetical protein
MCRAGAEQLAEVMTDDDNNDDDEDEDDDKMLLTRLVGAGRYS